MKNNTPKQINILIMEDDAFYNNLLAKKMRDLNQKPEINIHFDLNIKQLFHPDKLLRMVEENNKLNSITIAFVDYYLGYGINGLQLVYLLQEVNKNIRTVLLSQSEKILTKIKVPSAKSHSFIKIHKHEYTPDICCAIIENYIYNL